jgi:hypothetical protein
MITFNARTGEVFRDEELVCDDKILENTHSIFQLAPGTESNFSLLSVKRLLTKYPTLRLLTSWTDSFMAHAEKVPARVGVIRPADQAWGEGEIQYLTLQQYGITSKNELTGHADFDDPENGFRMVWSDTPSMSVNVGTHFCGHSIAGDQSLSYTPLRDVFYQPIKILNDKYKLELNYATEDRTNIDYERRELHIFMANAHSLSLGDMIMAIMMDLNLDDDEQLEDDLEMLRGRLDSCSQNDVDEEGE